MQTALWGICLSLAASGGGAVFVPTTTFTLAWMHSIEKVRWEEDYTVLPGLTATVPPQAVPARPAAREAPSEQVAAPPRLYAPQARIRGSAAGMEPPPGARLHGGWYHYAPPPWPDQPLRLTRSEFTADYQLCLPDQPCRPLADWLASDGGVTLLTACVQPP